MFGASGQDAAYIGVAVPPDDLAEAFDLAKKSSPASTAPFRTKGGHRAARRGGYRRARPALGQHGRFPRRKGHRLQYRHPRLFRVARTRRCNAARQKSCCSATAARHPSWRTTVRARARTSPSPAAIWKRPPRSSSRSPRLCRTRASPYTAAATSRATSRSY
ncbi:MAG: hypothetical protein ACLR4Z_02665 [Butyricicoccaceae bacterium]